MRRLLKVVPAAALALLAAGCSYFHEGGVALAPNPAPPPGYRAVCSSTPLLFNAFTSYCRPVVEERIVRAKG